MHDISKYSSGNKSILYAYTFHGKNPGPHVWINAVTHGNEPCGAVIIDEILSRDIRPVRGTLSLSLANYQAYQNRSAENPDGTRFVDEDLNRVWHKLDDPDAVSCEVRRARELASLADEADILIDLHEMANPTEPLVIVGQSSIPSQMSRGMKLAQWIGYPTLMIADTGHPDGVRLRDYGHFADPDRTNTALVVECGQFGSAASVEVARGVVTRVLSLLGATQCDQPYRPDETPFRLVEVTTAVAPATDMFSFAYPFQGDEVLQEKGVLIATDGPTEIRTPYENCFLMFPTANPQKGITAVRLGRYSEILRMVDAI